MPPPILYLEDMALTFGGKPLLTNAAIRVHEGDRIALVGRNGSGKSTLMKIAAGLVEADGGERFMQPGKTIRYLPQEPDLTPYRTIGDYVRDGLAPGDDAHRADYILQQLGLRPEDDTQNLSGGEARRAALARTLAPDPDILLLDEPTNHLDLPAIEWLEKELAATKSAIVLISHDRRFLSSLSRRTVWMDRGRSRTLEKGFAAFEDWRDKLLEEEETASHKLARQIVREEHWIVHGVSGRRKRNMRRVRELADLKARKAGETRVAGNVQMTTADSDVSGKLVAKLDKVTKAYDDRKIIDDFSLRIQRGDRIGIVGQNGAGKTTLINLITGKLAPDNGTVKLGVNLDVLVIDQKREALDPNWTLKDALTDGAGDMVPIGDKTRHVMSYMQDYLFLPEQARTPIHALSGGERGRLMLARGLRAPSNLLILDEPTNDLDLETLDLLQEFISDYRGTVLMVSHDRDFIDRTCTRVIAHEATAEGEGKWLVYAGGYSDMLAQRGAAPETAKKPKPAKPAPAHSKGAATASDTLAISKAQKHKLSFKQKHALENLPKEMEKLEGEIAKLKKALDDPDLFNREPKKFQKFADALAGRETRLAACEEEWLELEMLREEAEG